MSNHFVVLDGVDKIKSSSNPQVELVVDDTVNNINDLQANKLDATANAVSASKWQTARTLSLSGDASGSVSIDGTANTTLTVAVANDSHTHDGRYYTETEINNKLTTLEANIKNDLLGGAGAAYDTLKEIEDYINSNEGSMSSLLTNLSTKAPKPAAPSNNGQFLTWDGSNFANTVLGMTRTDDGANTTFTFS